MGFLIRLLTTALALWVAVRVVPGITFTGTVAGLVGVALIFGVVNALVRPLLVLLTLPLLIVTLGLFTFVLNALLLRLTSALSGALGLGFHVRGFLPALLGALVVSIVSMVVGAAVKRD